MRRLAQHEHTHTHTHTRSRTQTYIAGGKVSSYKCSRSKLPGIFHMHFSNGAANGNRAKCRQTLAASTSKCCPPRLKMYCISLWPAADAHAHTHTHTQTLCLSVCVCFRLILARTYMRLVNSSKHGAKLATVSHSRSVMHFCGCQRRRLGEG